MIVQIVCSACRGTGVYHGFAEPSGVGVVCLRCKGTGTQEAEAFNGLVRRSDIRIVRRSAGTFIGTGVGTTGDAITYEEFLGSKRP